MRTYQPEKRSLYSRVLAMLMMMVMVFTSVPPVSVSMNASAEELPFSIELSWNDPEGNNAAQDDPEHNFLYYSDREEDKPIRLMISYRSNGVSTQGYDPGKLVITVPGLRKALRITDEDKLNSYFNPPKGIDADKEGAALKTKDFSWSYTAETDTYTFTNNNTIAPKSSFEGSFEIMWLLPSRDTKDRWSQTFHASLFADGAEYMSNDVTYSQERVKDLYKVSITPYTLYKDKMPSNGPYYVRYSVSGSDSYRSKDVEGSEEIRVYFRKDALSVNSETGEYDVQGGGLQRYVEGDDFFTAPEGIMREYACYRVVKNINPDTPTPYLSGIFVGYDKNVTGIGTKVYAFARIYGTYYEPDPEDDDPEQLCEGNCEYTIEEYSKWTSGGAYSANKRSYGVYSDSINTFYKPLYRDWNDFRGAVNAHHLTNEQGTYYSDLQFSFNFYDEIKDNESDIFDIILIDDILQVPVQNGDNVEYRMLKDGDYYFSRIEIPANSSILNSNDLPIEANKYDVEIYYKSSLAAEFPKDPVYTTKITTERQSIDLKEILPENTEAVAVKIAIRNVNECISQERKFQTLARVYYAFHINGDLAAKIDKSGYEVLINNMSCSLYEKAEDKTDIKAEFDNSCKWIHKDDRGQPSYNERSYILKQVRDYDSSHGYVYDENDSHGGTCLDREWDTTPILAIPSVFRVKTVSITQDIDEKDDTEEEMLAKATAFLFDGSITTEFSLVDEDVLSEFTLYAYIPDDLNLRPEYKTHDDLMSRLSFSASNGADVASFVQIEVQEWKGKTRIVFHFDFGTTPLTNIGTITISKIPMYQSKKDLSYGLKWATFRAGMLIHDEQSWTAESRDGKTDWGEAFYDLDNDKNYTEVASFNSGGVSYGNVQSTYVALTKFVETPLTSGLVQSEEKNGIVPRTYSGGTYSYYLKATTGKVNVTNLLFVDVIEPISSDYYGYTSDWQGIFKNVVTDGVTSKLKYNQDVTVPQIYYSDEEVHLEQNEETSQYKVGSLEELFESGNWKTKENWEAENAKAIANGETGKLVRSVAVYFGDGVAPADTEMYLEIQMTAPNDNGPDPDAAIARNKGYIGYDKVNTIDGGYMHESLNSPVVVVTYTPKGQITVVKRDEISQSLLKGASFDLYKGTAQNPKEKKIASGTTNENGQITFKNLEYLTGDYHYYLVETQAPKGYVQNSEPILVESMVTEGTPLVTIPILNERQKGSVTITKVSDRDENRLLDGAKFGIYRAGKTELYQGKTAVTKNGVCTFTDLEWGDYYLKELEAPAGYVKSTEEYSFTIDVDHGLTESIEMTIANKQLPGKVMLTKYERPTDREYDTNIPDHSMENPLSDSEYNANVMLSGATYAVYRIRGKKPDLTVKDFKPAATDSLVTTQITIEGSIYLTDLDFGDYYFIEVSAAAGYQIYGKPILFTVDENCTTDRLTTAYYEMVTTDARKPGDVHLLKLDDTGRGDLSGKAVKGAVYRLYAKGSVEPLTVRKADDNIDGHYQYDPTSRVVNLTTNIEGVIEIYGIPWGSYYIAEESAPTGYKTDHDTHFNFTFDKSSVSEMLVLNAVDETEKGSIKLIKVDQDTNELLEGAEFTLYRSDNSYYGEYTTNAKGEIEVKNLPWGSYYFQETKAPANHGINPKKFTFVVSSQSAGIQQVITVTDPEVNYMLKVTKKIEAKDIEFIHGNPTFMFKVVNIAEGDDFGHTYSQTVTFDQEHVEKNTDSSGMVSISTVFTLDAGTYEVSEIDVSRYQLKEITINADSAKNVSKEIVPLIADDYEKIDNESGTAIVNLGDNLDNREFAEFEFVFENVKVNQRGTSDTAIVNNVLHKEKLMTYIEAEKIKPLVFARISEIQGDNLENLKEMLNIIIHFDDDSEENLTKLDPEEYPQNYTLSVNTAGLDKDYSGVLAVEVTYVRNGLTYKDTVDVIITDTSLFEYVVTKTYDESETDNYGITYSGEVKIIGYKGDSRVVNFPNVIVEVGAGENGEDIYYRVTKVGNDDSTIQYPHTGNKVEGMESVTKISFEKGIKVIGKGAFYDRTKLEGGLTFPDGLTSIGESAFTGCKNLTGDLILPDSVVFVGNYAFNSCSGFTSLKLSNNLERFEACFESMSNLSGELVIPESVKEIGEYTFSDSFKYAPCTLVLSEGLTTIAKSAFAYCSALTGELHIPASVKTIGENAFYLDAGFTSLTFAEGSVLEEIGKNAFYGCTGFTNALAIPESTIKIGYGAFRSCSGFTALEFADDGMLEAIGSYSFFACSGMQGVLDIPGSVKRIGYAAFNACTKFTGLELHEGLKEISVSIDGEVPEYDKFNGYYSVFKYALSGCNVVIPDTVEIIGDYAFSYSYLTGVTIPGSVKKIGYGAFSYSNIQYVNMEEGIEEISVSASMPPEFDVEVLLAEGKITNSYVIDYKGAFANCSKLTSFNIPESATVIGDYAFYKSDKWKDAIHISDNVKRVGKYAFYRESTSTASDLRVTEITLGNHLTSIGEYAFYRCGTMQETLIIPDSVETIGKQAFAKTNINGRNDIPRKIIIGTGITEIEEGVFEDVFTTTVTPDEIYLPMSITTICPNGVVSGVYHYGAFVNNYGFTIYYPAELDAQVKAAGATGSSVTYRPYTSYQNLQDTYGISDEDFPWLDALQAERNQN